MNILLVANYVPDRQESMQRFASSLAAALQEAGQQVRIVRPNPVLVGWIGAGKYSKWLGYVDKFVLFPHNLRASLAWADVVHICDHSNSFYLRHLSGHCHVITCHDLLAVRVAQGEIPQSKTGWTGCLFQRLILNGLNRAKHVVCDSEATRSDVLRLCDLPEERVSAIHLALNYPYSPMKREEAASLAGRIGVNVNEPFVLHVGGNQWYKNRLGVLRLFALLRERTKAVSRLVMVGKSWTQEMRRFAEEHSLELSVTELNEVSNEDLRALYSTAKFLLFPSLAEGYGWPVLEAQACGCPVVTSGRASLPEIGGGSAIYIDPEDSDSAVTTILESLDTLLERRDAGLFNARRFDSATMATRYIELYRRVNGSANPERVLEGNLSTHLETSSRS
jgi:glycosyltransferase involved in cell wall biosynthesis